jgi:WD40 repeat protein
MMYGAGSGGVELSLPTTQGTVFVCGAVICRHGMLGDVMPQWDCVVNALPGSKLYPILYACRAALQMACDAPSSSRIAQHSSKLPWRPAARCLTKEHAWSGLLATLHGHSHSVQSVAISPDGKTIVSGSDDHTVR